jgi:hypothetical protein
MNFLKGSKSKMNPYQEGGKGQEFLEDGVIRGSNDMGKYDFQFDNQLNLKQIIRP